MGALSPRIGNRQSAVGSRHVVPDTESLLLPIADCRLPEVAAHTHTGAPR